MIRHDAILRACRAYVHALEVCTTGVTTLEATATGYARASGSFIADGFAVGMQVTPLGFSETTPARITALTALTMRVDLPRAVDSPAGSRELAVRLPDVAWANVVYQPITGRVWFREEYLPGGGRKPVLGAGGTVEAEPLYLMQIHVPQMTDLTAAHRYADALCRHFAPGTTIPEATHDIRVRADITPSPAGVRVSDGWAVVTTTIPLRVHAPNAI